MKNLRVLVIDDIALVAQAVRLRLGKVVPEIHVDWMSVTSEDLAAAVRDIQDRISVEEINFLVVDRGILDQIEVRDDVSSEAAGARSYVRRDDAHYADIVDILEKLASSTKRQIGGVIVYTLDEPDNINSPWFVDDQKMTQELRGLFGRQAFIDIIKTRSDIYQASGLKLFYPVGVGGCEEAKAGDLTLYGTIVGEMVWSRLSGMLTSRHRAERRSLRGWLLRNYFLLLAVTIGLGIGVNAAYDLLRVSFTSPWVSLIVGVAFGIFFPIGMLIAEPRILLPPIKHED